MVDLFGDPIVEDKDSDDNSSEASAIDLTDLPPITATNSNEPDLVGHLQTLHNLEKAYKENRFPHGILLTGPKGIGKAKIAQRIASYLLSSEDARNENLSVNGDSSALRLIKNGAHPDLFIAEPAFDDKKGVQKAALDAETIRKIAPFMRLRPSQDNGWRVVIIDEAHTMTNTAQNSLLKIIEEPPSHAVLIVVSTTIGHLLPTIKSRVQHYKLNPLSMDEMKNLMPQLIEEEGASDLTTVIELSNGSPGKALELIENSGLLSLKMILEMFNQWPDFKASEVHKLSDSLSRYSSGGEAFRMFKENLLWILRQGLLSKAKGSHKDLPETLSAHRGIQYFYETKSQDDLMSIHDDIQELLEKTEWQALDKGNAILQIFAKLK